MPATVTGVNVEVSSHNKNNVFEEGVFAKLADVLRHYNVDMSESVVEVTGEDGVDRKVTAAMNLIEGDTIVIMKAKNKSGN